MALAWTGPHYTEPDFLPMYEPLKRNISPPESPTKKIRKKENVYDSLGRNLSEQEKRQNAVPWIKVKYHRGRLFIPDEKKATLVALKLI
jgi:hypothetical protein